VLASSRDSDSARRCCPLISGAGRVRDVTSLPPSQVVNLRLAPVAAVPERRSGQQCLLIFEVAGESEHSVPSITTLDTRIQTCSLWLRCRE
jgi:hypothetical protein